jgi:predicted translin family RNA/ssDNA-binding protein
MLNKKDFEAMRKEMDAFDKNREDLIAQSREVIKLSKKIIYAIHRKDMKEASASVSEIKQKVKSIMKLTEATELEFAGARRAALQEYVEAICYFEFIKGGKVPTHTDLGLDPETYLLGICDLSGELVRNAIHEVIDGDTKSALKVKDVVTELFWELSQFDFRNGELRRKFDGIKYDLKKLEDLALQLKLRQ